MHQYKSLNVLEPFNKSCYPFLQVGGPPAAGAFRPRHSNPTNFRKFYERGDFPIALEHDTKGNKIAWKVTCLMCKIVI